jgi:regulator of protease activity HflC (stomatin/prohibitin superfamily)
MGIFRGGLDDSKEYVMRQLPSWSAKGIGAIVVAVLAAILLFMSIKYVPAGHVGVLVLFGRVTGEVLPEGTHLANPLKTNKVLSVRTQEREEKASVPSNEGLIVALDTSLLFRLDPTRAHEVYREIGENYVDIVVIPNFRSAIRSATAAHTANALYTGERELVADEIKRQLTNELSKRGIVVESVLLRDVQLPSTLRAAIEAKQQAEQEALRMNFVLQREKQEAERKRIEAQGISDFQRIVAQGISQQLLTWKGIEATEKLANSQNAKVVIIGSSRTGLPIILGTD